MCTCGQDTCTSFAPPCSRGKPCCCEAACTCIERSPCRLRRRSPGSSRRKHISENRRCDCCAPEREDLRELDRLAAQYRNRQQRLERQDVVNALLQQQGRFRCNEQEKKWSLHGKYPETTASLLRSARGDLHRHCVKREMSIRRQELQRELENRRKVHRYGDPHSSHVMAHSRRHFSRHRNPSPALCIPLHGHCCGMRPMRGGRPNSGCCKGYRGPPGGGFRSGSRCCIKICCGKEKCAEDGCCTCCICCCCVPVPKGGMRNMCSQTEKEVNRANFFDPTNNVPSSSCKPSNVEKDEDKDSSTLHKQCPSCGCSQIRPIKDMKKLDSEQFSDFWACPSCGVVTGKINADCQKNESSPIISKGREETAPKYGRKVLVSDLDYLRRREQRILDWEKDGLVMPISGSKEGSHNSSPLQLQMPVGKWKTMSGSPLSNQINVEKSKE